MTITEALELISADPDKAAEKIALTERREKQLANVVAAYFMLTHAIKNKKLNKSTLSRASSIFNDAFDDESTLF